jgi:hypothetical protein
MSEILFQPQHTSTKQCPVQLWGEIPMKQNTPPKQCSSYGRVADEAKHASKAITGRVADEVKHASKAITGRVADEAKHASKARRSDVCVTELQLSVRI